MVRCFLLDRGCLFAEDKIDSSAHAQCRPQVVPFERLLHVEEHERDKDRQGDDFLKDLKLWQAEGDAANSVGGYLQHVFKKRDGPTGHCRNEPGLCFHVLQVGIPRESHKNVGDEQERDCFDCGQIHERGCRILHLRAGLANDCCSFVPGVAKEASAVREGV